MLAKVLAKQEHFKGSKSESTRQYRVRTMSVSSYIGGQILAQMSMIVAAS